ncbi:pectate lyase [Streptomyces alkaliphilus]|uniref:pectate lyase n=1 Tax=Streptomyces alkaliphilus TaxID=1472722 RepID=UPI00117F08EA|nr:pectate lyase [Streptomyces alkaliphilus]MQS10171.1 pectate lyase [Streptomyces alkaliphilus]
MAQHKSRRLRRRALIGGVGATALIAGAAVTGTMMSSASAATWPSAKGEEKVTKTIEVKGTFDGGGKRYIPVGLGDGRQGENQKPVFKLAAGATLKNVIIGAPGADGVHCQGSCTIENVWWEDVGEDAATFRGGNDSVFHVKGGGARKAEDKVLQHNGGGRLTVEDFAVEDFLTLYRSCGNCGTQYKRSVTFRNIEVKAPGTRLAGINTNYGDTATFQGITILGDPSKKIVICQKYEGNNAGKEPKRLGTDADGKHCVYKTSDITWK